MESFVAVVGSLALEIHPKLPVPPPFIGLGAFLGLAILLLITLAIGRGRPHS